jgi:hypothetical protein
MNVIVPVAVGMRVAMSISMSMGVLVHPSVFYVDTAPGAAFAESPLLDG